MIYKMKIYFLLALSIGCSSSSKIVSNKDETYTSKLKKVFVIIRTGDTYSDFAKSLADSVTSGLERRSVDVKAVYVATNSNISISMYANQIQEYQPQTILMINNTSIRESWGQFWIIPVQTGTYLDFNLSLVDVSKLESFIWRSNMSLSRSNYGNISPKEASIFTKTLIDELTKYALL